MEEMSTLAVVVSLEVNLLFSVDFLKRRYTFGSPFSEQDVLIPSPSYRISGMHGVRKNLSPS